MTVCDFFAGLIAGMAGLVAGYPIDTIKVRQQLGGGSMREVIKNIHQSRGWRVAQLLIWNINYVQKGFYRGLTVPMLANGVLNAVYFSSYAWIVDLLVDYRESKAVSKVNSDNVTVEDANASSATVVNENEAVEVNEDTDPDDEGIVKKKATNMAYFKPKGFVSADQSHNDVQSEQATFWDCFIGGWLAGVVSVVFACPVEVIKVRLQSNLFSKYRFYRDPLHVMKRIYVSQGPKGFYRGVVPMSHRNFIAAAVNYSMMKVCIDLYPESPKFWYQTIPAAALAGMASWSVAIPLDVIKTQMQSDNLKTPRYKSMVHCADQILQKQGPQGFFRGLSSMSLRTLPVNAATFVIYEWIQTYCGNVHREI